MELGRVLLLAGYTLLLLTAAAGVAAAARIESTTTQSEESAGALVAAMGDTGRSLKSCRPGWILTFGKCACKPGYGWSKKSRNCVHCPPGWYNYGRDTFSPCKKCRSDYLVDEPIRSRCQSPCIKSNDFSVTYWKGYIAVAYPVYYYDWQGSGAQHYNGGKETSAAEICRNLDARGYGFENMVPAIIPSSHRTIVNFLAHFHFKCYPKNYYYWTWKSWNDKSLDRFGRCERCRISDGIGLQLSGNKCFPEGGARWKYPVICSKGCDFYCRSCKAGRCQHCTPGYTPNESGDCVRDFTPFVYKE